MNRTFVVGFLGALSAVMYGCASSESDVGQGVGGSGNTAGKSIWDGGGSGGAQGGQDGGWGTGGTAGSTAFGGTSGTGFGGSSTGGSGAGATGGSSFGGTSGVGGSATGGSGGSATGGTGGSASTPTTCAEAHGLVGCCLNNDVYYWECAKLTGGPGSCQGQPCGWDATNSWYDCGFTGADPSGQFPKDCGGSVTAPGCPGTPCCQGNCGSSQSPSNCACDSQCTSFGDCCPDACQLCGAC